MAIDDKNDVNDIEVLSHNLLPVMFNRKWVTRKIASNFSPVSKIIQ